jgi:hypothetical protein
VLQVLWTLMHAYPLAFHPALPGARPALRPDPHTPRVRETGDDQRRLRRRGPATPAPLGSRTPASDPCAAGRTATQAHAASLRPCNSCATAKVVVCHLWLRHLEGVMATESDERGRTGRKPRARQRAC